MSRRWILIISVIMLLIISVIMLLIVNRKKSPATIRVGAHIYTEQQLAGHVIIKMLDANGYEVEEDLFSEAAQDLRSRLKEGEVDIYLDLTSSALVYFYGCDPEELSKKRPYETYEDIRDRDAKQGIVWLDPMMDASFTYVLMIKPSTVQQKGIVTLEDLANYINNVDDSLKLCTEIEFEYRADGLESLQNRYGFRFKEANIIEMEDRETYKGLYDGECDVAQGRSGSAFITAWGFHVLENPLECFPPYVPAPVIRQEVLDKYPELPELLAKTSRRVDTSLVQSAIRLIEVGLDGEPETGDEKTYEAAANWLLQEIINPTLPLPTPTERIEEPTPSPTSQSSCYNIIKNGSFERDSQDWLRPIKGSVEIATDQVHSGSQSIRLGIISEDEDQICESIIYQDISIPVTATTATLSYWHYSVSQDLISGDAQRVLVTTPDRQSLLDSLMTGISNEQYWVPEEHDLSDLIGETATIKFLVFNDGNRLPSAMYIDDVRLEVCFDSNE